MCTDDQVQFICPNVTSCLYLKINNPTEENHKYR